jgi:hypothetical protein
LTLCARKQAKRRIVPAAGFTAATTFRRNMTRVHRNEEQLPLLTPRKRTIVEQNLDGVSRRADPLSVCSPQKGPPAQQKFPRQPQRRLTY